MRKWGVVALIAVVLLVAAPVALVLMFRSDSVEELKRDYVAACSGDVWTERLRHNWNRMTGTRPNSEAYWQRERKRIEECERVLIKAGYLEERRFIVSDLPPSKVMHDSEMAWFRKFPPKKMGARLLPNAKILFVETNQLIARLRIEGTNVLVVVAPRESIPQWEKIVKWEDAR